jgi:hypothetical protein
MTKSEDKAEKNRRDSRRLGMDVDNLIALRKEISRVRNLQKGTSATKRSGAARQLGISAPELQALERALAGTSSVGESVKATARQIISHRGIEADKQKPTKRTSKTTAATKAATASAVRLGEVLRPGEMRRLGLDAVVFVTEWGGCVHTFQDCHGIQGFLPVGEPDRIVVQVTLRASQCSGRRFCEVCCRDWVDSYRLYGDKLIRDFHGSAPQVWPARPATPRTATAAPRSPAARAPTVAPVMPKTLSTLEAMKEEARRTGKPLNPRQTPKRPRPKPAK